MIKAIEISVARGMMIRINGRFADENNWGYGDGDHPAIGHSCYTMSRGVPFTLPSGDKITVKAAGFEISLEDVNVELKDPRAVILVYLTEDGKEHVAKVPVTFTGSDIGQIKLISNEGEDPAYRCIDEITYYVRAVADDAGGLYNGSPRAEGLQRYRVTFELTAACDDPKELAEYIDEAIVEAAGGSIQYLKNAGVDADSIDAVECCKLPDEFGSGPVTS